MHAPFHDERAFRVFLTAVSELQPAAVVLAGDLWDFYELSRFDKDPTRATNLQSEIDAGVNLLKRIRSRAAKARIVVVEGNHEERLRKYLWSEAPGLSSLRCLKPKAVLDLEQVGAHWSRGEIVSGILVTHGGKIRQKSGYSAHAEIDTYYRDGMSGHTHRLARVSKRLGDRTATWWELGCLCDMSQEYLGGRPADWQHGFAIITDRGNAHPGVELVEIRDGVGTWR